jgi:hypothetical protein
VREGKSKQEAEQGALKRSIEIKVPVPVTIPASAEEIPA